MDTLLEQFTVPLFSLSRNNCFRTIDKEHAYRVKNVTIEKRRGKISTTYTCIDTEKELTTFTEDMMVFPISTVEFNEF